MHTRSGASDARLSLKARQVSPSWWGGAHVWDVLLAAVRSLQVSSGSGKALNCILWGMRPALLFFSWGRISRIPSDSGSELRAACAG
jgi:hypothetical protein